MTQLAADTELDFRIELERWISASIDDVFGALLAQLGPEATTHEGNTLSMKIEPFPGGRWYRDLGDNNGHHWAHVQAIKRPTLLELTGPLFMSRGVCNNVQYRLEEMDGVTTLRFVHSALGYLSEELREGMTDGWSDQLDRIASRAGGA